MSKKLYFESKKESKPNQTVNIGNRCRYNVDNYYHITKIVLKKEMKKLTCHCGGVEAQVRIPEEGFKKIMRCNCSLCKRKGYIIGVIGPDDLKIVKGENLLKLYQYYTKTAKHYFCSNCGIHTHNNPRSNPKLYGVNIGCVEGIEPFEPFGLKNIPINDGVNHPLDKKK